MYERLDKLRAEVDRLKQKVEDDKLRLKAAEAKLKAAENSQILADVGALNLSPEQLAQFLAMVKGEQAETKPESVYESEVVSDIEEDEDEDV